MDLDTIKKIKRYHQLKEIEREISPRMFPIREEKENYIHFVESLQNKDLQTILRLILCTGFRVMEAVNSYILYDHEKDKYFVTGYALKRASITNFKLQKRDGVDALRMYEDLQVHPEKFKTVPLVNIFNLNIEDFEKYRNEVTGKKYLWNPIHAYLARKDYFYLYKMLKKEGPPFRVYYLNSRLSGVEKEVTTTPSFHFFRKLFVAELYYELDKDVVSSIEYMKWAKMDRIFDYVKLYENTLGKIGKIGKKAS